MEDPDKGHTVAVYGKDDSNTEILKYNVFTTDMQGLKRFWNFIIPYTPKGFVMEATGIYHHTIALFLRNQIDTTNLDAEIYIVNPADAYCKMSGYQRDELIGNPISKIEYKETTEEIKKHIEKLLLSGYDLFQTRHRRKDGTIFDVEISSSYYKTNQGKFVSFLRDITERKQNEKETNEHYHYLKSILQTAQDGFVVVSLNGKILDVNDAYCKMTNYSREELLHLTIQDMEYNESPEDVHNHIEKLKNQEHEMFQTRHRKKDGSPIDLEISASFLEGQHGKFICFCRDITDRLRAEENRNKLQMQLIQAQKMESIGQLAGGVAHDFNNMLGVILGYTQLILKQTDNQIPIYGYLEEIQKAARHSANLAEQLLAFARQQPIAPKALILNDEIERMLKMLRRLIGERIMLRWEPSEEPGGIFFDPSQLGQIIMNLCVNARDAIKETGTLIIRTANFTLNPNNLASHPGMNPGDYCQIDVIDDGCGMDELTQARLFEPFFTTKELGKGTGLGLSIIYGIIKQNNGHIEVLSQLGKGTTFHIYIPRYFETPIETPLTESTQKVTHGSETILVIEDEPSILSIIKMILEHEGYNVLTASNPSEALNLTENYCEEIQLIITDVIMPEMNGIALLKILKDRCTDIKYLYMSGYTADIIGQYGILEMGQNFLRKPFSIDELTSKVRKILDQ